MRTEMVSVKMEVDDVYMAPTDNNGAELDDVKKRFHEMEDKSAALTEMKPKVKIEMDPLRDPTAGSTSQVNREEVDSRSVFVGNVDYSCTPEEVHQHFQSCGTVNRVTIRTNKYGQPRGYAYVEFVEAEAVKRAILLNETELHGRQLKITAKRTNIPGMKQYRPRRFKHVLGSTYILPQYGYGKAASFRLPMHYSPYY